MLIYKINFSLLTLFSLLIYIVGGRGLKGRAGCRQAEVQTDRQTDIRSLGPTPRIGEQTNKRSLEATDERKDFLNGERLANVRLYSNVLVWSHFMYKLQHFLCCCISDNVVINYVYSIGLSSGLSVVCFNDLNLSWTSNSLSRTRQFVLCDFLNIQFE